MPVWSTGPLLWRMPKACRPRWQSACCMVGWPIRGRQLRGRNLEGSRHRPLPAKQVPTAHEQGQCCGAET
jgi:hypothetical protein